MTLAEYSQGTGQDRNSVLLDYGVFVNVPRLNAQDRQTVQRVYKAEEVDFRLEPSAAAVDRGLALPNVNDEYRAAPDLGLWKSARGRYSTVRAHDPRP